MYEFGVHGPVITPYSPEANILGMPAGISMGNAAWPAANRGYFFSFTLYKNTPIVQGFVRNNTGTGNVEIGVFLPDGTLVGSTGAINLAASNIIYAGSLDLTLGPGTYYAGMSKDGTGGNNQRLAGSTNQRLQVRGVYQMSSAYPLPSTVTFAAMADNYLPIFGLSTIGGL